MQTILFSTQNAAQAAPKQDSLFLDGGIHENVKLTNVRIDKTQDGSDFIEFTFTNPEGRQLKQTEYSPRRFPNQSDEKFQESINTSLNLMTDIFECFYEKGTQAKQTESFLEYITWVKQILDATGLATPLRIKATYKLNGFVTLAKNSKYTFIERMDANPVKVVKMRGDQFERPVVADKEQNEGTVVNATQRFMDAADTQFTATGTDGLPF
jgi:hypothetical protein